MSLKAGGQLVGDWWGGWGEGGGRRGKEGGGGDEVPDEFDGAGDADALSLEVLAQRGEEPQPDFLVEDVEHRLVRAADQHLRVARHRVHDLPRGVTGADIHDAGVLGSGAGGLGGVEVRGFLRRGAHVLDFRHEDLDAFVQARGDALVEHLLEALLLLEGRGEEVGAVGEVGGDEFLLVEDVEHLLDQVADVDELEEGDQWRHPQLALRGGVAVATRVVVGEVGDGLVEAGFDVAGAEDLEEEDEDELALLAGVFTEVALGGGEDGGALDAGFGGMDEVEGDFDAEEGADPFEAGVHDGGFGGELSGRWLGER